MSGVNLESLNVTLSRTVIPSLPPHFISRKHLFSLIESEAPGSTLVIAPSGFGKSALISEWAQLRESRVIWMTVSNADSLNEMSAMMIAATRQILPGFGEWFERDQPLRPTEVVRRWGNELLRTGENFIFVLDNIRSPEVEDVEISSKLIEQFPLNIHFIAIRRSESDSLFSALSSRGQLKTISGNDLRFSDDEIEMLANNSGLAKTLEIDRAIKSANGWPTATSLLIAHIANRGGVIDSEAQVMSELQPLKSLAMLVLNDLDEESRDICLQLSIVESFTTELAKVILGDTYSYQALNSIALNGEIFTRSRDPRQGFIFSPFMREIFQAELWRDGVKAKATLQKLIAYFEMSGDLGKALEYAFLCGDSEKITELFQPASRINQALGKGDDLLRWAKYVGVDPDEGDLKKSTVEIAGLLTNFDFVSAAGEISRLESSSQSSPLRNFYAQFSAGAQCYLDISLGNFAELEKSILAARVGEADCYLGVDDQIGLYKVLAAKRYIWNESAQLEEIAEKAEALTAETTLATSHTYLLAIRAMNLHQQGEYLRAYETATIAVSQFQKYKFVGILGPLDAMYVQARCLHEFSRREDAMALFEQIRSLAQQWRQWHWYFTAENHLIQDICLRGHKMEALARVKASRELVSTIEAINNLAAFADVNEMYPRRSMGDMERLETLVKRAPDTFNTRLYKMVVDDFRGRKSTFQDAANLPARTPRDKYWKLLTEATLNIDKESIALPAIRSALKIGAEVGLRETFLRQSDEVGSLIIRVANESPTIYNEELATAMAERMKERGKPMTDGQPALTKRELEILRQLATGRTLTVIAGELHISQNTMKTHLKNLYKKLAVDGRDTAVEKAKSLFLI